MNLTDEVLCAYLDGELDAERRSAVERALAGDRSAERRLAALRAGDNIFRNAFPRLQPNRTDPIAALIQNAPLKRDPVFGRRNGARALALIAACAAGLVIGRVGAGTAPAADPIGVSVALASALDSAPSGETVAIPGARAYIAQSFQTPDGAYCREFDVQGAHGASQDIACRRDGAWRVIAHAEQPHAASGYRTAGAEADTITASINALGEIVVLGSAEEQALIARSWR